MITRLQVRAEGNGLAIAGLVLGIISMFTWQFSLFALPIPMIGIILSALGRRSTSRRTMATVGLVLSIISIVLTIRFFIVAILVFLVITPAFLVGLVVDPHYFLAPYNYDLSDPGSIPNLVVQHLSLVGITMFFSLIIAIPLGIVVARYRRLYLPVITVSGLLYTIPSIAAFAFLIPITQLTPATAIIPLVLYNQLVLIRNTAAAINGIDPLLIEVGRAMGMKPLQILFRVTFPLALPIIVAGIRIAVVTTVGIAALAALVAQGGLGDLIFKNIVSGDFNAVAAGAILTASFAIVADLLLLSLQIGLNRGRSAVSVA